MTRRRAVLSGRRVSNLPVPGPSVVAIARSRRRCTGPGRGRCRGRGPCTGSSEGFVVAGGTCLVARSWGAAGNVDLVHPGRLVTAGPYADRRNPMYVGWALLHLGVGVAAGSAWIVASLPVAVGFLHHQVLREERALAQQFPVEFERYRTAVPRYRSDCSPGCAVEPARRRWWDGRRAGRGPDDRLPGRPGGDGLAGVSVRVRRADPLGGRRRRPQPRRDGGRSGAGHAGHADTRTTRAPPSTGRTASVPPPGRAHRGSSTASWCTSTTSRATTTARGQAGATLLSGLESGPEGSLLYRVEDLEGHRWMFMQRPG